MRKFIMAVMVCLCLIGGMAGIAQAEEVTEAPKMFEIDLSGEAKLLYQPIDGTVDYGFGAKLVYVYDRVFYVGAIWVPGENLSTNKGDGRKALYGPEIGVDVIKGAEKIGVNIELPDLLQLDIGLTWLANLEGGLKFEKAPRITLVLLRYDF